MDQKHLIAGGPEYRHIFDFKPCRQMSRADMLAPGHAYKARNAAKSTLVKPMVEEQPRHT